MPLSCYWDANVFHALFGMEPGRIEACTLMEAAAREGRVVIYTSTVTFVECIWLKGHPDKLSPDHEERIAKYFSHKFIRAITCDRVIAEQARALIWKHPHLKPKDAIHAASALFIGADVMHTFDNGDLVRLDGKLGSPPMNIRAPSKADAAAAR